MPKLSIAGFDGISPRTSPTMLGDNQAQLAQNVKLYARELRYWRGPVAQTATLPSNCQSIYKYYAAASNPYWLAWQNANVDVVLSPLADLTDYRFYYTGDGVPKKSNETLVNTGSGPFPRSWLNMGVPAPAAAPTCTISRPGNTVTITIASPGVVTDTGSNRKAGDIVEFSTTGALPTGIVAGRQYVVTNPTTDTYQLLPNNGTTTPINTSGTQSGVHKAYTDNNKENRVYVYTYTSTFGSVTEESAPSPASSIIGVYDNDTVTVNGFSAAPTTNYNITGINIYRSVTGSDASTYLFVASIAIATSSYADTILDSALGNAIPSIGWNTPPSNLAGLVGLPSGSLAGFVGNTVYFSEPYHPHAWPAAYALSVPHNIVGLGVFGTSIAVMTDRYPYIINGGIPGAMSVQNVPALEPCLSKRSIVSTQSGVMYASPNGMMNVGPSMTGIVTNALFRRDEWQAMSPANIIATLYDTKYFALYPSLSGFTPFILSVDDVPAMSTTTIAAAALHVDAKTGNLYYVDPVSNTIFQADADANSPLTYQWQSKRFVMPQQMTFSAIQMDANFGQADLVAAYNAQIAAIQAQDAILFGSPLMGALNETPLDYFTVDGSAMLDIPAAATPAVAQVLLYGDGVLKCTLDLSDLLVHRIPPFRSKSLELLVRGNINVRSLALATTVQELVGQ